MMTRRSALKTAALAAAAAATISPVSLVQAQGAAGPGGSFTLPSLPYAFDALEPHIDARTMEIHHGKHHAAYVANLNKAVAEDPKLSGKSIEEILHGINQVPEKVRTAVRNNGGGHHNHTLFWQMMKKGGGGEPQGELAKAIEKSFGNFAAFREQFSDAAMKRFGSGWAWLVAEGQALKIESTPNQDSILMEGRGKRPLLGVDVWEHAYYLKYQNRRADYLAAWFNVANWDFVAGKFEQKD